MTNLEFLLTKLNTDDQTFQVIQAWINSGLSNELIVDAVRGAVLRRDFKLAKLDREHRGISAILAAQSNAESKTGTETITMPPRTKKRLDGDSDHAVVMGVE